MATTRVCCPACNAELEIDARHVGEEVECGSCLKIFVAERPRPRPRPSPNPTTRRSPNRSSPPHPSRASRRPRPVEDDDDDYTPPHVPAEAAGGPNAVAVLSLVFGIISLPTFCCGCLSFPASVAGIVCGIIGMQTPQSKGLATVGLAISVVGLLLSGGFQILKFVGVALPVAAFGN